MKHTRGFTLIELLVALGVMALMAGLSWRGMDGMTRAQAQLAQRSDQVAALQMGLAQWSADLDALVQLPNTAAMDWDGRAFRLTRRGTASDGDSLLVVAWAWRNVAGVGHWLRWQSPPVGTRGELQTAWMSAAQWAQNPSAAEKSREVAIFALDEWKLFYYRSDAWTNPLSSEGAAPPPPLPPLPGGHQPNRPDATSVPDGVRLVLTLPAGDAIAGTLTRDWVRLQVGGGKS